MKEVRVRFAPSPTGALHIGGVRTALYNYLLARKYGGTMILRIEDTDQARFVPGAEEYIQNALKWIGIKIDEGFGVGGPHAPYRQSERKPLYKQYALQLVEEGFAYYAFDTPQELDAMRTRLAGQGQYNSATRSQMKNSLTMSSDELKARLDANDRYVIRLRVPENEEVTLYDLIRGEVKVNSSQVDDKVLMKSDGMPTYHLANVVDDYLMKISHVIRGEEWLPSAPLHVLLYKYLGWEAVMPEFAHLPLLLKPNGDGKLSKRDADQMGFPIFPLNWNDPTSGELAKGFKENGYLPDALANFLAFLGWNPGTEQEIFSMEQLITAFSIERIGKSGAKFDIHKAQWFNAQYLRAKSNEELISFLFESLTKEKIECSKEKALKICLVMKDRVTFPSDFWEHGRFFFSRPQTYDEQIIAKKWNADVVKVLGGFQVAIAALNVISSENIKTTLDKVTTELGISTGKILAALRVSITGGASGPDLMMTMEIIGKEEIVARLDRALRTINVKAV